MLLPQSLSESRIKPRLNAKGWFVSLGPLNVNLKPEVVCRQRGPVLNGRVFLEEAQLYRSSEIGADAWLRWRAQMQARLCLY